MPKRTTNDTDGFEPIEVTFGPQTPPAVSEVDFQPAVEPASQQKPRRAASKKED